jgi:hypothetical protein
MRIAICGSMSFSREMLEAKKTLEDSGHEATIPPDTMQCLENPELNMSLEHCLSTDIDKKCFDLIAESDAILVLNYEKNGVEGYVGGATLMEIGLARHLNKKIFLLNGLPEKEKLRHVLEIETTRPTILNGDVSKIPQRGNRMKITICGSSSFRREMVEYEKRLNALGHEAVMHPRYAELAAGKMPELLERIEKEHAAVKKQYDFIRWYYKAICGSDAILVLNLEKKGIKNYIGGNTLMEMGFAHVNNKKVFLLNPAPTESPYRDEIEAMADAVLDGRLENIK